MANNNNLISNEIETWQDLFKLTINKTMLKTNCATLAFVDSVIKEYDIELGYGIVKVKPFPLYENQKEYTINAYYFNSNSVFTSGQICCVVFTNYDFRNNLKGSSPKKTLSSTLHSLDFGVIIQLM